jgi:hypothetical protein
MPDSLLETSVFPEENDEQEMIGCKTSVAHQDFAAQAGKSKPVEQSDRKSQRPILNHDEKQVLNRRSQRPQRVFCFSAISVISCSNLLFLYASASPW